MSKGRFWQKKEPKESMLKDIMFRFWKPPVGEYSKCVKDPNSEVDKNDVFVVRANSHYKEEVLGHV